ncbi:putative methyltransferase type 11 [Haloferax larsenii JCM 13917]|nr:class I SAM-dependent methyltransferase [Haloferax larsenii]ELZ81433.1 putative methyltransferase type 11 [Haloferax larsenii JCM 13917]
MTHWTEQLFIENAETFGEILERRFEQASEEVEQLLRLVENQRGVRPERTLDVACGVGRHVLALAEEGCNAEGLDFSPEFIREAQERASDAELTGQAEFHVHDMRELERFEGPFDLVTIIWNSLGYYDKQTDVEMLSEIRRLLSEDGVLAIETSNKEFYVRDFEESNVQEVGDQLHVERKDFDVETGRFETTVDVFSSEGTEYDYLDTIAFQPRLYAPVELREMCERAGFEDISLFGGFAGRDVSLDSPRVVVLAE